MSVFPARMTHVALSTRPVMAWPLKYSSQNTLVANWTEPHAANMLCGAKPSETKFATLPMMKKIRPNQSHRVLDDSQLRICCSFDEQNPVAMSAWG